MRPITPVPTIHKDNGLAAYLLGRGGIVDRPAMDSRARICTDRQPESSAGSTAHNGHLCGHVPQTVLTGCQWPGHGPPVVARPPEPGSWKTIEATSRLRWLPG